MLIWSIYNAVRCPHYYLYYTKDGHGHHLSVYTSISILPSPCLSVNWKAWTRRRVSSTLRPTGRSLMVICLRVPLGSMMNRPLKWNKKQYFMSIQAIVLLVLKALHSFDCAYLSSLLLMEEPCRLVRSSDRGLLVVPKVKTKTWEQLEVWTRQIKLKTHLLSLVCV